MRACAQFNQYQYMSGVIFVENNINAVPASAQQ
jgi:hypothetical protein